MIRKVMILYYYFKYRYFTRFQDRNKFTKWQNHKIDRHLKNIVKQSKYYSELYTDFNLSELQTLPIISKNEMMVHFSKLNTVGVSKNDAEAIAIRAEMERCFESKINGITVGLSSGTSGNRGLFLASDHERFMWSGAILAKTLPNGIFSKEKVAFFLRANSNLYETIKSHTLQFKYFDTLNNLSSNMKTLHEFQPSILVAPSSQLLYLAKAISNSEIHLKCKKVIAVAEVLEELDMKYISKAFNQPIHQVYQATEGFLASTCKYGTLHLNEDIIHVDKEYLDTSKTRFMPIITDFTRVSQPILRYRLNDVLVEQKNSCECGSCFTALSHIEGRSDDLFYGLSESSNESIPIFSDFIRRAILFSSTNITEYKVIQSSYTNLSVYVSLRDPSECLDNVKEKIKRELQAVFSSYNCKLPAIAFENAFTLAPGTKMRRVERTFHLND